MIIATRGSRLALWQAEYIKAKISERYPCEEISLKVIKTSGDMIQNVPLSSVGGKGLFVKEIEQALLDKEADIAVHSLKDVPYETPNGLSVCIFPKAEPPNDAFLSVKYDSIADLPPGAVAGSSSLRRKLQLLRIAPHITVRELRGNVDTRIKKLERGEYDCIILAEAGLRRLGLTEHMKESIPVNLMLPSACQGILGVEVREDDRGIKEKLAFLNDGEAEARQSAERAFLKRLGGGCTAPIACNSQLEGECISVRGYLSDIDGRVFLKEEISGGVEHAHSLGAALADKMRQAFLAMDGSG